MAVPLARTDLTSRPTRAVAKAIFRGMDLYERLTSRLLVSVTGPADDPFYRLSNEARAQLSRPLGGRCELGLQLPPRRIRMMIKGMPTATSSVFSAVANVQQRGE